jgi:hypothetical protein
MKRATFAASILLGLMTAATQAESYLFAYFKEPGDTGIYFALSHDGYHYTPLNDGAPWFLPPAGQKIRDPYLTKGSDGKYRLVWTWDWRGKSIGYAESDDLQHWTATREIPIMADFPETNNTWAPEIYWDAKAGKWLVLWASAMKGEPNNHHIWSAMTTDFQSFTKPSVWFDPGYVTIDQTIFHNTSRKDLAPWYLIFKDQNQDPLRYQIRVASGPSVQGPWSNISGPITPTWSEGPSALQVGDRYVVFYDYYRQPARFKAVETMDWVHWSDATDKIDLPHGCKHGSFLKISDTVASQLEQRHDSSKTASK